MKPRLHYFDMLKGIAIFMVVMGHVLTMCVREIDRAAIFKFIGEVHMPLFFFISGWMAMRLGEGGNVATPALLPRAKRLLLPMLGASTLWLYYFPLSGLESPLCQHGKVFGATNGKTATGSLSCCLKYLPSMPP